MVKEPVVATLAVELPVTEPRRAELTTATWAGPPAIRPARAREKSVKNRPTPALLSSSPKIMKMISTVEETPSGRLQMPSEVRKR